MVKLIIAVMYSDKEVYVSCKKDLVSLYGPVAVESEEYDFDKFTKYYEKEMGKNIVKRFLIFEKPLKEKNCKPIKEINNKNNLIKNKIKIIKNKTTEIEEKYSKDGKRRINLDPGYLSSDELVLASFKSGTNYKEDIGDGVYLHKVLEFDGDDIKVFWHTFPDYKEKKGLFYRFSE